MQVLGVQARGYSENEKLGTNFRMEGNGMRTEGLRTNLKGSSFGGKVRAQRKFLNLSQEELAVKLGLDRGTIISYEQDRTLPRTREMRTRLAEVLELEYGDLYDPYDGLVLKAAEGVSMGIDFGQLRRSLDKNNGMQLRYWKKMCKFLLEHAAPSLTEKDRGGLESCLKEIERIRKERKAQNKRIAKMSSTR